MKALVITADEFEDLEFYYPYYRLKEAGWEVVVAGAKAGVLKGKHGYTVEVDATFSKVAPDEYDLLLIPGGKAPEEVRLNQDALNIVGRFFDEGRAVGAICHGPQVLASAGRLKGRRATCWRGVKDDIISAGAEYADAEVVMDGNLVTSRMPDDLPAFMKQAMLAAAAFRRLKGGTMAA